MNAYDQLVAKNVNRNNAIAGFCADLVKNRSFPGIVFCRKKEHVKNLAACLSARVGKRIPWVTSETEKGRRKEILFKLRNSDPECPIVVATSVWSTGIDVPSLRWVLIAGSGQAPAGLKQMVGRGTRKEKNKSNFVVYDWQDDENRLQDLSAKRMAHYADLGLPIDAPRESARVSPDAMLLQELLKNAKDPECDRTVSTPRNPVLDLPNTEVGDEKVTNTALAYLGIAYCIVGLILLLGMLSAKGVI